MEAPRVVLAIDTMHKDCMIDRIGILGAGAWGTALAVAIDRAGRKVTLQAHDPEVARAIDRERVNVEYLPGVTIDRRIQVTSDPSRTVATADAVLLAIPAQHLRSVLRRCAAAWRTGVAAVICAKGIEQNTCALMSEVVEQTIPGAPVCVLSGPSFAAEVA